jgi:hypothetical protein
MANKETLTADIVELAAELEVEAITDDLTNKELVALKAELTAKLPDAEAEAPAAPKAPKAPAPPKADHVVADGKSVTSLKGIKGEGDEVFPGMFSGGSETFANLIERGVIVKQ